RWLDDDRRKLGEETDGLREFMQGDFCLFIPLMNGGRRLELERFGGSGALTLERGKQACPMSAKRLEDSVRFGAVAVRRGGLIARRQALFHLEIGAGG